LYHTYSVGENEKVEKPFIICDASLINVNEMNLIVILQSKKTTRRITSDIYEIKTTG